MGTVLTRHIVGFLIVGSFGFLIEAVILTLLVNVFDIGPIVARVPSFLIAVLFTWLANRKFTFTTAAEKEKVLQGAQYLMVQTGGIGLNMLTYVIALHYFPYLNTYPVIALAMGSAVGLVFNFSLSKWFVFASHRGDC